jgi:hypothetical protein
MALPGELAEQRLDMIPRRCQWAGVAGIHLFNPGACVVSEQLMLRSGEWVREWRIRESLE